MNRCQKAIKDIYGNNVPEVKKNAPVNLSNSTAAPTKESNVKKEINGPNREAVVAAILRDEKETMSRRLRVLDSVQVSQLAPVQRKEAYRLRHLLTQKRLTPEQEEATLFQYLGRNSGAMIIE